MTQSEDAADPATLTDLLAAAVRDHGDAPATDVSGQTLSYRALADRVDRAAAGLARLGVGRGDRVALVLPNCPAFLVAAFAVWRLGAIAVAHHPDSRGRELRHLFEDHTADVAIVWTRVADRVDRLPEDARPAHLITVSLTEDLPLRQRLALRLPSSAAHRRRETLGDRPAPRGSMAFTRLLEHGSAAALRRIDPPGADDAAVLQYTAGATGAPMGAILRHRNLTANVAQARAVLPELPAGAVVHGVLPFVHAWGLTLSLLLALRAGARLVLFPTVDLEDVVRAQQRLPAEYLVAVPPLLDRLAAAAEARDVRFDALRFAFSGGTALPERVRARWARIAGGPLIEGYGLSEASPLVLAGPPDGNAAPGTAGRPVPGTAIRVVDPDDPRRDTPGVAGELLVRGPQVFTGYWKKHTATRQVLLPDGWLRTGDVVTVADDDVVTVVDRVKDVIVSGGYAVTPSEVEAVLRDHQGVREAAVVGLLTVTGSEEVVAVVVMDEHARFREEALRAWCARRLAPWKVPRRIVAEDALPTDAFGAVNRRRLRHQLAELAFTGRLPVTDRAEGKRRR
ncbi:long-chain-fatty-acid--CoA ligase [Tersicoccus solisilvae]|uniref:Long-chain-fatty-acid--CoA ligase n=1 Tax=Tersicoccus solisilvae TaxID=1882339 RepID=A0ABQ1NQN6_9MICC|nr:AMP-binding protein [Tersicoccus solisilvae]GGC80119.1 long-chain-fatty-acid--CoA ligase [Tersicoccus solisilvae]